MTKKIKNSTKIIKKNLKDINISQYLTKKYFDYCLVVFSLLLGFYLRWDSGNIALFTFVIFIILNPISSQVLAKIALFFLFFMPMLLIIGRDTRAEQFATFAYIFLVLTAITALVEHKSERLIKPIGKGK